MHSHHSHSGQFCQHAKGQLEDCIRAAIKQDFKVFCLTEHMPRLQPRDLYAEEIESGTSIEDLATTFDQYFKLARALQVKYADTLKVLVGFEAEAIDAEILDHVLQLQSQYHPDMIVGSLHHVSGTPIDFDQKSWDLACTQNGGIEGLLTAYFDQQYTMIEKLKPQVVGHFDLIRLFSPNHDLSAVWPLVERNVRKAAKLGCLFEINTAAIRKGWATPYPQPDVADLIKASGGRFCLSCDSHRPEQVGQHFTEIKSYIEKYGPLYAADGSVVHAKQFGEWADTNKPQN